MYVPLGVSLSAGGASETESDEDASAASAGAGAQGISRRNNAHQEHLGLHRLAFLEQWVDLMTIEIKGILQYVIR